MAVIDDNAIQAVVTLLARPHSGGGQVIERAAIMASGADSRAIEAWILAHAGEPEQADAPNPRAGLHGHRLAAATSRGGTPRRFVLPPGVL